MAQAPFVTDPVRTAIALAYRNEQFIADQILPRAPVGAEEFKWISYNKEDRFTIPSTLIDRKGEANQVEFGGTEQTAATSDYGLEDVIPNKDLANARTTNFDVLGNATELLTDLVLLDREKRVADLVGNPANYGASYKETLGATDKWNHADGDPIDQISAAMEVPFMRPNVMQLSSNGLLALRKNASIVKAYNGSLGDSGMVPVPWLEALFEVEIVVGRARYNTAKPGQTMTLTRLWGNNALLFYRNPSAMPNRGLTFGLTAQFDSRVAQRMDLPNVGLRGGVKMRVGESVKELVLASDVAYFIEGVI